MLLIFNLKGRRPEMFSPFILKTKNSLQKGGDFEISLMKFYGEKPVLSRQKRQAPHLCVKVPEKGEFLDEMGEGRLLSHICSK